MQEYKKRVRRIAERYAFELLHRIDGTLSLTKSCTTVKFSPTSRSTMTCTVINAENSFAFDEEKKYIFDIIHRLGTGHSLDGYQPKGEPLTLDEYISEEHAAGRLSDFQKRVATGDAENTELGENHYNVEYYNGIYIVFDIFTGAPTNVYDLSEQQKTV